MTCVVVPTSPPRHVVVGGFSHVLAKGLSVVKGLWKRDISLKVSEHSVG